MKKQLILLLFPLIIFGKTYSQHPCFSTKRDSSRNYPIYRIGFCGGIGYTIADNAIAKGYTEYSSELKMGTNFGVDASYFLTKIVGVGFKYSNYSADNYLKNALTLTTVDNTTVKGDIGDNISIDYLGPIFTARIISPKNYSFFLAHISIGYISYINYATHYYSFMIKGNSVGYHIGIDKEVFIQKNIAVGLGASYTAGFLHNLTLEDYYNNKSNFIIQGDSKDISRIDLSVSLRLLF